MATILIVDDDLDIRTIISQLAEDANHKAHTAATLAQGLDLLASHPVDLVFLDVRLPDGSGIDALEPIRQAPCAPVVIIITGLGDPDGAELAIQNGAWDYIEKTSTLQQIMFSMDRALRYRAKDGRPAFCNLRRDELVGESRALQQVLENIAVASSGDAGVLISGETGTGKEVVARTIHENSPRANGSFVVLDCASLSASLAEGELFGHVKGSFTGAEASRIGLVGQADGGTLFLDEVGELPQAVQANFLRVLQEKRYRPVGSTKELSSDFRLVAATNRDLEEMCATGQFRSDLYYRIKACAIPLPPLRRRLEDIPDLCRFHLERLCRKYRKDIEASEEFLAVLGNYHWPGNVRELVQTLERTVMRVGDEKVIYPEHLPVDIRAKAIRRAISGGADPAPERTPEPQSVDFAETLLAGPLPHFKEYRRHCLAHAERVYLRHLLELARGDAKTACKLSGISRTRFYALLKEHDLNPK
ncbi:MAG: sigma-54-dependent transcriptional regulator [Desulfovibrio sp.]